MCFAAVAAGVSIAATAISTGVSISAQNKAAEYNAKVNDNNALIADQKAKEEMALAGLDAIVALRESNRLQSAQRTALSSAGFDVNTGTGVDLVAETAARGAYDAAAIIRGGAVRARDAQVAATNFRAQAAIERASKGPTILGGALGAASSAFSTFATYKFRQDYLKDSSSSFGPKKTSAPLSYRRNPLAPLKLGG